MHNYNFTIDGFDANDMGIILSGPVEFSAPVPIYHVEKIPGRNGTISIFTGSFENRKATAQCFCLQDKVVEKLNDVNRLLFSNMGYRKLTVADDPDHYWMARITNGAQIAQRLGILAPFDLKFDCMPQRFVNSGNYPTEFTENGNLRNPFGFTSKPLIELHGEGEGNLIVNGLVITVNISENVIYIDSEKQNAYNDSGNQNSSIYAVDFPSLHPGENSIEFNNGIEKVIIYPRWWEL